jgi:acyl-coenzyme A thioesterase PaaI-like protein
VTTLALPELFGDRCAALEEQFLTTKMGDLFADCFGCGPEHPIGLRVRCFKTEEGVLTTVFVPGRFMGPRGAAHGGIVTTYLDEILAGAAFRATGRLSVTGEITVRFVKPVPLETPLLGRGRLAARHDHDRYVDVEGVIEELGNADVLARARGRFFFSEVSARAEPGPRA